MYRKPAIDGRIRLYLDIRVHGAKRAYDFKLLRGFELVGNRAKDAETGNIVRDIVDKMQSDISSKNAGIIAPYKQRASVFDFLQKLIETKKAKNTRANYVVLLNHLKRCCETLLFRDFNEVFVSNFKQYLLNTGVQNSTVSELLRRLNSVGEESRRQGFLTNNPVKNIVKPKTDAKNPVFLSIDEIRQLSNTPCPDEETKRAFLFCCFTGLRLSDAIALEWSQIKFDAIEMVQTKTKTPIMIPLAAAAKQLIGERKVGKVFDLPITRKIARVIKRWVKDAGIDAPVTFHSSRHTFATLTLSSGADLKTVSSLMGHSSVAMTERYAKVVDATRQTAIQGLPEL